MKTKLENFNPHTCKLMIPFNLFAAIHKETNGDPCGTGCCYFDKGKCQGFINLKADVAWRNLEKPAVLTNKEIAEKLHCSKREVARMRKNGTLPEGYK